MSHAGASYLHIPRIAVSICAILQFSRSGRARENPMKLDKSAAAGAVGLVMLLVACVAAKSAEVKVMAGSALAGFIGELGPEFERTTGHKLVVQYGLSRAFRQQIEAGEAFDLAILSVDIMDELVKQGKLGAGTFTEIARAGMGVAVRNGTPKPDINSVDAFRRSLLNAKSISYAPATEGGEHMDRMFERLGVAEQMKSKVKPQQLVSRIAQVVAVGDAELGIAVTSLLLVSGVELVGKIPEDLQLYLIFTATVGDTAKQPEAARALVRHLTSPAAAPVIKAKGWEPATR
jgi:molybdate transport system substrate-binding protein